MNLQTAVKIALKEEKNGYPIHGYESDNYFVFTIVANDSSPLGNNCSFVVNKRSSKGEWLPQAAFPLDDDGNLFREYDEEDIRRVV